MPRYHDFNIKTSWAKFCSYTCVLNKAPNNSDVKHVANIMLNEAPNCNSATRVGNNVRLTAVGAQ